MAGRPKSFDPDRALAEALDLFWLHGYGATSVRGLLDHMKISWQSLYDTFGNKHDLFLQALRRYDRETLERTQTALTAEGSPLEQVKRLVRAWGERVSTQPFRGCLINNSAVELSQHQGDVAQIVREHLTRVEHLLQEALDRAREAEELPEHTNTRALARFLTSTAQGLIVLGKAGLSQDAIQDVVEVALTTLS